MADRTIREALTRSSGGALLLDAADRPAIAAYLAARGLGRPQPAALRVERAGAGNMNLTLRVAFDQRSLILKQGRPWVEKYDHIAAPWERTVVEGTFYRTVGHMDAIAGRMPGLLDFDAQNHVLALEDLGAAGDYTSIYADRRMDDADLDALLEWLAALGQVPVPGDEFANREMRALNHEHIFRFPLVAENGLDLDGITPGLSAAADVLRRDRAYCRRVADLGTVYLSDGEPLVHGDYFPGSWVRTPGGIRIIDPEFCFRGAREFDYGVMLAHFALGRTAAAPAARVLAAARQERLDQELLLGLAGTEIMRRLIGVAQLPLPYGLDEKRRLLEMSRALVLSPGKGLSCWA